jgi:hypothetical protein
MSLKTFRDTLVRILSVKERRDNKLDISSAPSEQSRLLHRLNCINLDDEEAKTLARLSNHNFRGASSGERL